MATPRTSSSLAKSTEPADLAALVAALAALVAAHTARATSPAALAVLGILRAVLDLATTYRAAPSWWRLDARHVPTDPTSPRMTGASLSVHLSLPAGYTGFERPDDVPAVLREAQARSRAHSLRHARELGLTPDRLPGTFTRDELRAAGFPSTAGKRTEARP